MAHAIDPRQLPRMDSPQRVQWLRSEVSGYIRDLAARAYFRLETWCADQHIPDPKAECVKLCGNLAETHGLTEEEMRAAFQAEWGMSMKIAEQVGEKLRIVGLSHIKMCGSTQGLEETFFAACNRFPPHWPYLTRNNLENIAAGFQRPARRRRAA